MSKHDTAVSMIEGRLEAMAVSDDGSVHASSEASMALEMAYALGVISCEEHTHFTTRRDRIIQRQHDDLMFKMRRQA